jgi:hypothetical protein
LCIAVYKEMGESGGSDVGGVTGAGVVSVGADVSRVGEGVVSVGKGVVSVGEGVVSVGDGVASVGNGVASVGSGVTTVGGLDGRGVVTAPDELQQTFSISSPLAELDNDEQAVGL